MNAALSMFPESKAPRDRETLSGWKQIASELNRSVRTVQRWQGTLGMPVRRLGSGSAAPVFAFKEELHRWLASIPIKEAAAECAKPIIALVENLSQSPKKSEVCSRCTSAMKYLDGQFWLFGTDKKWNVSVPVCPTCEPELCHSSAIN
jgi:hypothetical protein